jgi:hypothetical protein
MLYREIIAVCSQIHTKHINRVCGQNVELLNDKPCSTHRDDWDLRGISYEPLKTGTEAQAVPDIHYFNLYNPLKLT